MTDELLDAVDLLTRDRVVHTTLTDDDGGWVGVHSETHPPLLRLLIDGNGFSRRHASSETPLPIDPDALEILAQITERVALWCRMLKVAFDRDELLTTVRRWFLHHQNLVRAGRVTVEADLDITRTVQSWVRMIGNKFEPQEKREWEDACVNVVSTVEGVPEKCGARRIVIDGREQFAIELNVTSLTATCRACGHSWVGQAGLSELRFLTNVDNQIQDGDVPDGSAINIVANLLR